MCAVKHTHSLSIELCDIDALSAQRRALLQEHDDGPKERVRGVSTTPKLAKVPAAFSIELCNIDSLSAQRQALLQEHDDGPKEAARVRSQRNLANLGHHQRRGDDGERGSDHAELGKPCDLGDVSEDGGCLLRALELVGAENHEGAVLEDVKVADGCVLGNRRHSLLLSVWEGEGARVSGLGVLCNARTRIQTKREQEGGGRDVYSKRRESGCCVRACRKREGQSDRAGAVSADACVRADRLRVGRTGQGGRGRIGWFRRERCVCAQNAQ